MIKTSCRQSAPAGKRRTAALLGSGTADGTDVMCHTALALEVYAQPWNIWAVSTSFIQVAAHSSTASNEQGRRLWLPALRPAVPGADNAALRHSECRHKTP